MDFLRTCYSSRFYYSRNPDRYVVGQYHYAADDAEVLTNSFFYRSGIWLDPWELGDGLGDSMEDYAEYPGEPLPANVLNKRRDVIPLQTSCDPVDGALLIGGPVTNGIPDVCWRTVPPPASKHSYATAIDHLRISDGARTYVINISAITLKWSFSGYWYYRDASGIRLKLVPESGYPAGSGMSLYASFFDSAGARQEVSWLLPLGSQQGFWGTFSPPVLPAGYIFESMVDALQAFVPVVSSWPVNPLDTIP